MLRKDTSMDLASSCISKIIRKGGWTVSKLKRIGRMYDEATDRMIEASNACSCDVERHVPCDNWKHRVLVRWEKLLHRLDTECRKNLKQA